MGDADGDDWVKCCRDKGAGMIVITVSKSGISPYDASFLRAILHGVATLGPHPDTHRATCLRQLDSEILGDD